MEETTNHLHIEFYADAVENPAKTRAEGRKVCDEVEMVRIRFVGDRNRELVAPANSPSIRDRETNTWVTYAERFPKHYAAFKGKQAAIGDGTPLTEAPWLNVAQRAELGFVHIHTIDQLAAVSDSIGPKLGQGWRAMRDQAQAWIDKAKGMAVETRLSAENAELREEMKLMREQMVALSSRIAPAPVPVAPVVEDDEPPSLFDAWTDEALKNYIKMQTGAAPRGNPSHATLVRMASEAPGINAEAA